MIDGHSDIIIDISKNMIENKIVLTKSCEFQYGRIFFRISDLQGNPLIEGLNYSDLNQIDKSKYEIILSDKLMDQGRHDIIIHGKISKRFHKRYDIINDNALPISSIIFRYDTSLLKGYFCDNCFSLLEGNLVDKGNWDINTIEGK